MQTKVHGAGATTSSVPRLQKGRISRYKYLFLSSASPSGLMVASRFFLARVKKKKKKTAKHLDALVKITYSQS